MVWFVIAAVLYFAVIFALLVTYHRLNEASVRDKTVVPDEELRRRQIATQRMTRQAGRYGGMARYYGTGAAVNFNGSGRRRKNGCAVNLAVLLMVAVAVAIPCVIVALVRRFSVPQGFTQLKTDSLVFPYLAAGFLGMGCIMFLPFASVRFGAFIENKFGSGFVKALGVSSAKAMKLVVLFSFIFCFPFFAMGLNYSGSYNDTSINYHPFFSLTEIAAQYSEITNVNRYFERDDNDKISGMDYVITLPGGKKMDILFGSGNYIEQTYEIHGYILAANPSLFDNNSVTDSVADITAYFDSQSYGPKTQQKLFFIFGIAGTSGG